MSFIPGALTLIATGAVEGIAFFKAGLYNPEALHSQMQSKTFSMLKLFIAAVGTSMVSQAALNAYDPKRFDRSRAPSTVGWLRTVFGSLGMGIGVSLCGLGPSLFPGALLTTKSASITLAGAFAAGLTYALLERYHAMPIHHPADPEEAKKIHLDKKMGISYTKIAAIAGTAMVAASFGIEQIFPHVNDMNKLGSVLDSPWLPTICGILIGLNQIPLRLLTGDGAGASTSIMNVLSTFTGAVVTEPLSPRHRVTSFANLAQIGQFLYMYVGTPLGVYYMMKTTPEFTVNDGFPALRSFAGGFLIIFSARLSEGCLCGVGISAMSELHKEAPAGAAAIFGGGILAALFI